MYYIGLYVQVQSLERDFGNKYQDNYCMYRLVSVSVQFSSVQSLTRVPLFVARWTTACQASLSITNSQSLLKLIHPVGDAV